MCIYDFSRFALLLKSYGKWKGDNRCVPISQVLIGSFSSEEKEQHLTNEERLNEMVSP